MKGLQTSIRRVDTVSSQQQAERGLTRKKSVVVLRSVSAARHHADFIAFPG